MSKVCMTVNVLCFVPSDNIRDADLPQSGEEGKESEEDWTDDVLILLECGSSLLSLGASAMTVPTHSGAR